MMAKKAVVEILDPDLARWLAQEGMIPEAPEGSKVWRAVRVTETHLGIEVEMELQEDEGSDEP